MSQSPIGEQDAWAPGRSGPGSPGIWAPGVWAPGVWVPTFELAEALAVINPTSI